ncbi:MAG: SlyX family protein [Pirellulaceae bacterium]
MKYAENSEQAIIDLQIALAHQQRLCEQLNEIVVAHTRQIIQLEREQLELKKAVGELRALRKVEPAQQEDEKPPHY